MRTENLTTNIYIYECIFKIYTNVFTESMCRMQVRDLIEEMIATLRQSLEMQMA